MVLHNDYGYEPWSALFGGMITASVFLFAYISHIYRRFSRKPENLSIKRVFYLAFFVVFIICAKGLWFISGKSFNGAHIRKEFTQLHPILRVAVSTLVNLDDSLIVTDAARQPGDYKKMRLSPKPKSLHYKQGNGFVHAIDLRTRDRSEIRNLLVTGYFKLMGFQTLRHNEAGDHLHISINCHEKPWAM